MVKSILILGVADLGQCKNDPQIYIWPMNDFRYYSGFEDQKREYYGRSQQAKYCLRMAEICIVQGKDGTLTENWYMIKTSGKQPS